MPGNVEERLRCKLTEAQRKIVAELRSELSPQLKLAEPNQRVIEFTRPELDAVLEPAQATLSEATRSRRLTLRTLVQVLNNATQQSSDQLCGSDLKSKPQGTCRHAGLARPLQSRSLRRVRRNQSDARIQTRGNAVMLVVGRVESNGWHDFRWASRLAPTGKAVNDFLGPNGVGFDSPG